MTPQKKIMAFGTFDYFHAGHENFLAQAKTLGDFLLVVISRDKTVQKIKSEPPRHTENERLKTVEKNPNVNKAVLGDLDDHYTAIKKYRPDVIALGYDQHVFTLRLKKILIDAKLNTEIHRLTAYKPDIYKSSIMKKK
ncbi:adenylyltransferase/cytidyltransferase family protein [Candidatus Peregrinibacteria bacterium]|nr:adenylyltransferase/cytidyltransferase family protein [Candidatus Peregrinibacteria bacterium]